VSAAETAFRKRVVEALADPVLDTALARTTGLLAGRRRDVVAAFGDFERARDEGRDIKDHTLANLEAYLVAFERNATAAGAVVHWAETAEEARAVVIDICRSVDAKTVTKSKSMLGEEIGINAALEAAGIRPIETDLGEHIIQLAGEMPSHIIMPALHKTREEVSALFARHHRDHVAHTEVRDLVASARREIRDAYFAADVGITGANFLIAETGSAITVTNEGNAELTTALPRVHIAIAGIEKIVPTLADMTLLLRLLARSALGVDLAQYVTLYTGPRRAGDRDGPEAFHIVLVDHKRTDLLGGAYRDMLRCIRCGACMNECPVFGAIGGHAYGWVYPGPMGAVLTPTMLGLDWSSALPGACTLNGRCAEVCPVRIPLAKMLRRLRADGWRAGLVPLSTRLGVRVWAALATRPALYRAATAIGTLLARAADRVVGLERLPFIRGWTRTRRAPKPAARSFRTLWRDRERLR